MKKGTGKKNAYRLCDCMTVKSVALYKNEEEAHNDEKGFVELLDLCLEKVKKELGE